MLAANEIKVDGNELVQILTLSRREISELTDPFGCPSAASPLFTYPFFGEEQIVSLPVPPGMPESVLETLEIVLCICNELVDRTVCFLGANEGKVLGMFLEKIEGKLKEMAEGAGFIVEFYHSWSEFQQVLSQSEIINDCDLFECTDPNLKTLSASMSRGKYYNHLQLLLPFYIEAATPIDSTDPKWYIYLQLKFGDTPQITGLLTAYNYFKYPEGTRVRISQVLVLPRYQGKRLGSQLYRAVSGSLRAEGQDCVEIGVEDPTDAFERIRGLIDYQESEKAGMFELDQSVMAKKMKFTPEHCERLFLLNKSLKQSSPSLKRAKLTATTTTKNPSNIQLRQDIKRWLLKKYRKDLPENSKDRIAKLAELYEGEMDEFIEPLINILQLQLQQQQQ